VNRHACAAFALAALTGCANLRAECATHGGSPWLELTSPHFVVHTNLDDADAREATRGLEQSLGVLRHVFAGEHEPRRRVDVVLFRNTLQLQDILGRSEYRGVMMRDWHGPLLVVGGTMYMVGNSAAADVVMHELTHHASAFALAREPRWLAEGLATYFETTTIDSGGTVRVGDPMLRAFRIVQTSTPMTFEELWQWTDDPADAQQLMNRRYAASWMFVHFFYNQREAQFIEFLRALSTGVAPRAAFAQAFPGLRFAQLDEEARHYLAEGSYAAHVFPLGATPDTVQVKPLADAQVHAELARIALASKRPERAAEELDAEQALDPNLPLAFELKVLTTRDEARALALAREFTTRFPNDATAFRLLAMTLQANRAPVEEVLEAARRSLTLDDEDPHALSDAAMVLTSSGAGEEAVPLARKAALLAPYEPAAQFTLAAALSSVARCDDAAAAFERGSELFDEHTPPALRKRLVEQTRAMMKACAPSP
jgi:hypothetical protein